MSSMTESLLLEAQTLRLEGDHDGSIHLLRTVISQCNSDIAAAGDAKSTTEIARRMRQVAVYQLTLMLLQRCGRYRYRMLSISNGVAGDKIPAENNYLEDEEEADELSWKLGYRLRLSAKAFGYPSCRCRYTIISSEAPLHIIDDAIAPTLFGALQFSFRPDSKYWSEFYSRINGDNDEFWNRGKDFLQSSSMSTMKNQFASHNIVLPSPTASEENVLHHIQNASSLLEQVAISVKHKLLQRFPELRYAKSVEIWCHKRPPDGCHQLHYDMDEIRLQERRQRLAKSPRIDQKFRLQSESKQESKRRKLSGTNEGSKKVNDGIQLHERNKADGIFSPLVSCILTIYVPNSSNACKLCNEYAKGTPTIICNQSIFDFKERKSKTHDVQNSKGWLCYPKPNRLLAFEGSLLHGVIPGIPEPGNCEENFDSCSSCSSTENTYSDHNMPKENFYQKRVTLMMGFWGDGVCTQGSSDFGPNTQYPNVATDQTSSSGWANEFLPINIGEQDHYLKDSNSFPLGKVIEVQPLWTSIGRSDDTFCEFIDGDNNPIKFTGRFFLSSDSTNEIDNAILHP